MENNSKIISNSIFSKLDFGIAIFKLDKSTDLPKFLLEDYNIPFLSILNLTNNNLIGSDITNLFDFVNEKLINFLISILEQTNKKVKRVEFIGYLDKFIEVAITSLDEEHLLFQIQEVRNLQVEDNNYNIFRNLIENSTQAVFVISPDLKILFSNNAFTALTNIENHLTIDSFLSYFLSEESNQLLVNTLKNSINSEIKTIDLILTFKPSTEKSRELHVSFEIFYDDINQAHQIVGNVYDQMSKIQDLNSLLKYKTKLNQVFNVLPTIVFSMDFNNSIHIEYINKYFLDYIDFSKINYSEKIEISNFLNIIHPDDKDMLINEINQIGFTKTFLINLRIANNVGSYRWFGMKADLNLNERTGYNEVIGIVYDDHDRKLADEGLKNTLTLLNTIIDNFPGIMFILDKNLKIINCSKNANELFNLKSKKNLINKNYIDLYIDNPQKNLDKILNNCIKKGFNSSRISSEQENERFGKSFKIFTEPIITPEGIILGCVETYIDISDFTRIHSEMKELIIALKFANKLSDNNSKKIQKLNEDLAKSENNLKDLNARKDRFFSILAHDLRSPFQGLLGVTNILHNEFESLNMEENKELISSIDETVLKIYKLLENLLEWSRIQRDIVKYIPNRFNLKNLVDMNLDLFKMNLISKKITASNDVHPKIEAFTDLNIINTILRNLISNAIKFTPNYGQITIYSKTTKNQISFFVSDSGVGMDKKDINKLFKIEEKITTLGTNNETGSGLGLILCKELIQKCGGEISVESKLNSGTTFKITLPISSHT